MGTLLKLLGAATTLAAVFLIAATYLRYARLRAHRYKPQPLLTPNEYEFYQRMTGALPELLILPQVSMAAVIAPAALGSKDRLTAFRRISQKRIDFLVCRKDLSVVCAVELDDRTHSRRRDEQRDAMMGSAGVSTLRFESRAKPSEAQIATCVSRVMAGATWRSF